VKHKLLLGLLLLFLLAGCSPPPVQQNSVAVQIPEALTTAIGIGIFVLLTAGFVYLFQLTGLDLRGYATGLAGTISLFVVTELQNIINAIPEAYDPYLDMILRIIVIIVGGMGLLYLRKPAPEQPKALLR
jgi:hypothetical protein